MMKIKRLSVLLMMITVFSLCIMGCGSQGKVDGTQSDNSNAMLASSIVVVSEDSGSRQSVSVNDVPDDDHQNSVPDDSTRDMYLQADGEGKTEPAAMTSISIHLEHGEIAAFTDGSKIYTSDGLTISVKNKTATQSPVWSGVGRTQTLLGYEDGRLFFLNSQNVPCSIAVDGTDEMYYSFGGEVRDVKTFCVSEGWLYCLDGKEYYKPRDGEGNGFIRIRTDGQAWEELKLPGLEAGTVSGLFVTHDWVYFSYNDMFGGTDIKDGLYRMRKDCSGLERLTSEEPISFAVRGDTVYGTYVRSTYNPDLKMDMTTTVVEALDIATKESETMESYPEGKIFVYKDNVYFEDSVEGLVSVDVRTGERKVLGILYIGWFYISGDWIYTRDLDRETGQFLIKLDGSEKYSLKETASNPLKYEFLELQ